MDKYLSKSRYFFGKKSIELRSVEGSKYYGIIAIKEYGPTTYAGAFDGFLQMPFEFVMTQSFNFSNGFTVDALRVSMLLPTIL